MSLSLSIALAGEQLSVRAYPCGQHQRRPNRPGLGMVATVLPG
ncbi:hypothetical protein [Micromonospora sp. KC723]|nr:hypothetical protein [Micromonospora sp. KC723]